MLLELLFAAAVTGDPRVLAARAIDAANELRLDEAAAAADRAYALALACDDVAAQSLAVEASAVVARSRGDRERALAEASLALALAELTNDPAATARAHNSLGRVYADLTTDAARARAHYERALALAPTLLLRSRILNNLGNLARLEGRRTAAMQYFARSLEAATRANDRVGRVAAEHNTGLLHAEQNDPAAALVHFGNALRIERTARTLLSVAEAHRALGDLPLARRVLAEARALAAKDELTLASILLREADLAIDERQFAAAQRHVDRSRSIARRLGDFRSEPLVDAYAAKLALARGELLAAGTIATRAATRAAALAQYDIVAQARSIAGMAALRRRRRAVARAELTAAVEAVERQRMTVAGGSLARQRFFGRELFPYEQLIVLLADEGAAAEAERIVELKKARVIAEASRRRRRGAAGGVERGSAIVNYVMAGTRAFAIVRAERVRIVPLPVSRDALVGLANRFARSVAQRDNGFVVAARELYDAVWAPLALPKSVTRVRVLPDEQLWRVPFAALVDPRSRFLVQSVALSYAPALSEIAPGAAAPPRSILLAANLPSHPTEIASVAALYRGLDVAVLERADEATLARRMRQYDVVHLAAHGVLDDRDPLESHLELRAGGGEDGRLTARELMEQPLAASLLVLSSCDSASGDVAAGEGLIGMTWAALIAGCPTVVASQWQVASSHTSAIMTSFHRALREGRGAAASLQEAQLAASRVRRFAHPYYWAAFVVVGS